MTAYPDLNPRYVVYALAHGRTPDQMMEHDKERYPGGKMCGFMLWISDRWQAWHKAHGYRRHDYIITREDHGHFDEWIKLNHGVEETAQ